MHGRIITLDEGLSRFGPLSEDEVLHLGLRVAAFLADAHRRSILHLALSTGRVSVDEQGTVILDEGAERAATGSAVHRLTLGYAAPEVLLGDEPGPRTDVYKAGLLLQAAGCAESPYARLGGVSELNRVYTEPPFPEPPPFSSPLRTVVERCQSRDPDVRYADGDEMLAALQAVAMRWYGDDEPPNLAGWLGGRELPPPRPDEAVAAPKRPGVPLAALVLVLALTFGGLWLVLGRRPAVQVTDLRLAMQRDGARLTWQAPVDRLGWSLSAGGRFVGEGEALRCADGRFVVELTGLAVGTTYVFALVDGGTTVGQVGLCLPGRRP